MSSLRQKRRRISRIVDDTINEVYTCMQDWDDSDASECLPQLPWMEQSASSLLDENASEQGNETDTELSEPLLGTVDHTWTSPPSKGALRNHKRRDNEVLEDVGGAASNRNTGDFITQTLTLSVLLARWAVSCAVEGTKVTSLLKILHPHHPDLPLDSRTLLKTNKTFQVVSMDTGHFIYFGVVNGLLRLFNAGLVVARAIHVKVNIDGLPLFKSSRTTFWPILMSVKECVINKPFVVALYVGKGKPSSVHSYLSSFISEMKTLLCNGFYFNGMSIALFWECLVADTPARAYVKCVKGHCGYYSCEKCEITGRYSEKLRKVTFIPTNCAKRTGASFVAQSQPAHHTGVSPLTELAVDLVASVPLDYMHLVCLGVMKKLIVDFWTCSKPSKTKLHRTEKALISEKLVSYRRFVPAEFARKPRSMAECAMWKATEFRNFLMYTGPAALKEIMNDDCYMHFLHLSVATSMLVSPSCMKMVDVAEKLLIAFVKEAVLLYGKSIYVMNVHALIHLAEDVRQFGSLDNFSSFPFENFLQTLKKMIRSPNLPLQQAGNRLNEYFQVPHVMPRSPTHLEFRRCHSSGPLPSFAIGATQFKYLKLEHFSLKVNTADSVVKTSDGNIVKVINMFQTGSGTFIVGNVFQACEDFFDDPVSSSSIEVYLVSDLNKSRYHVWGVSTIKYKMVCLPVGSGKFLVSPLFHLL